MHSSDNPLYFTPSIFDKYGFSLKFMASGFVSGLDDCEFERSREPRCHWRDVAGKLNWIRHNHKTPSTGTGPNGDISQFLNGGNPLFTFP